MPASTIHVVFIHVCSDWKDRRMVFTSRVVAFAHIGAEKMLDVIPLDEIVNIHDCDGINVAEADEKAGRVLIEIEWKVGGIQTRKLVHHFSFDNKIPAFHFMMMNFAGPRRRRSSLQNLEPIGTHEE
jgi:hypothetical protein